MPTYEISRLVEERLIVVADDEQSAIFKGENEEMGSNDWTYECVVEVRCEGEV